MAEGTQGDPEGTKDKRGLRKDRVASVTRKVNLRGKSPLHGTQGLRPHMTPHTGRVPRPSQLPSKELAFIAVLQSHKVYVWGPAEGTPASAGAASSPDAEWVGQSSSGERLPPSLTFQMPPPYPEPGAPKAAFGSFKLSLKGV